VPTVRRCTTGELTDEELDDIQGLLLRAFEGDFPPEDWEHAQGGDHILVVDDDGAVLAHAAVVPRVLEVEERPFRTGYVEAVATEPDRQRQGHGALAMGAIHEIVRERYELGALGAAVPEFYLALGWETWSGPTGARDGIAVLRTEEDDGWVMVLRFGPSASVDLAAPITCEVRSGDYW
jgi:aminoglycoside 2'-N-acetyltransferase I